MKINKKNKYAERIKNKILDLINSIESSNKELKFYEEYKTAYGDIYPNTQEWPTDKQYRILKKFSNKQTIQALCRFIPYLHISMVVFTLRKRIEVSLTL